MEYEVSKNTSLPWSESFISEYQDKWVWDMLSMNKSLPWSYNLINRFKEQWEWVYQEGSDDTYSTHRITSNRAIIWDEELLLRIDEEWEDCPKWPWPTKGYWTYAIVERFYKKWDPWLRRNAFVDLVEPYADDALVDEVMQRIVQARGNPDGQGSHLAQTIASEPSAPNTDLKEPEEPLA